jgi:type IX secretion system PorP/SprF family membrane protein
MSTLRLSILLICIVCGLGVRAQDPALTQYNSAPLYLNPGFAGSNECGRAMASYRVQWYQLGGGYTTFYSSYDHYFEKLKGGIGLMYMNDISGYGVLNSNSFDLVYSANIKLFDNKLLIRPGIDIGYKMRKINYEGLTFGDMIDPRRGFTYTTQEQVADPKTSFFDLSSGVVFATKHLTGGIAMHHLTEPDEGFFGQSKLPIKYTMHAAGLIGAHDEPGKFSFSPHVLFQKQQDFQQLLAGLAVKYDKYLLGASYRNKDAFIIQAGFQSKRFRAGYSYDHTISGLRRATGGSHELAMSFNIFCKEKKVAPVNMIAF